MKVWLAQRHCCVLWKRTHVRHAAWSTACVWRSLTHIAPSVRAAVNIVTIAEVVERVQRHVAHGQAPSPCASEGAGEPQSPCGSQRGSQRGSPASRPASPAPTSVSCSLATVRPRPEIRPHASAAATMASPQPVAASPAKPPTVPLVPEAPERVASHDAAARTPDPHHASGDGVSSASGATAAAAVAPATALADEQQPPAPPASGPQLAAPPAPATAVADERQPPAPPASGPQLAAPPASQLPPDWRVGAPHSPQNSQPDAVVVDLCMDSGSSDDDEQLRTAVAGSSSPPPLPPKSDSPTPAPGPTPIPSHEYEADDASDSEWLACQPLFDGASEVMYSSYGDKYACRATCEVVAQVGNEWSFHRRRLTIRRDGDQFSCTCPYFQFSSVAIESRTCPYVGSAHACGVEPGTHARITSCLDCRHLIALRGADVEGKRLGRPTPQPDPTLRRVPAPHVLLARPYDPHANYTGWWISEKLDGVRLASSCAGWLLCSQLPLTVVGCRFGLCGTVLASSLVAARCFRRHGGRHGHSSVEVAIPSPVCAVQVLGEAAAEAAIRWRAVGWPTALSGDSTNREWASYRRWLATSGVSRI